MPALGFTDQRARMRRILENAIEGGRYTSMVSEEEGRMVVLQAQRQDGTRVSVRFRAVASSEATEAPQVNALLNLRDVAAADHGCLSLFGFVFPSLRSPGPGYTRVSIEAGAARLDIVCQDAEWWEDPAPLGQP
jgi:hypothetical protein